MVRFEKIVSFLHFFFFFFFSAEMILERLNLQDILEEEKRNLLELEKLKVSQKSNPTVQKQSPCTRSEINRTTGIIVERTIENIKSVNHSTVDVSKESEGLLESDLPVKLTDADSSEGNQKQITDGKSNHVRASQIGSGHLPATQATNITADKMTKPNMDKSLNIQDVSLTEMLNSSSEDEDPVNVSSIIGSLCVGQSLTDVASQASLVGSNVQETNMKANVPSKTSTPIRPHSSGKNVSFPTNKPSTSKSQLSLASTYNGPKSNTDSLENQEKSAIRKTIENRLTQVNYKSALTEQSRSEADTNNDLITAIEGEHRLICVTDKHAKKSKEKSGKKLSSKLKEKLNIAADKDKVSVDMEQRGNAFEENDDFETADTTNAGRKRKRINVIDDSDDEYDKESDKSSKTKDQINRKDKETMRHSNAKPKSDKRRKVDKSEESSKDSQSTSKESGKSYETFNESSNDSTPALVVSKKTISKLQKFAFDDSRSSSSDSFLSNTSLSSSMLSGSLWISNDKTGKPSQKTDSGVDNEENEDKNVTTKRRKTEKCSSEEITMSTNGEQDKSGSVNSKSWKETEKDKHINSSCASKTDVQTSGVSLTNKLSQNDHSSTVGSKLSKFKLKTRSTVLQSSENISGSNRSSPLLTSSKSLAPQTSEHTSKETSVLLNSSKPTNTTVLPSSQNSSSLNKSSVLLNNSSPSWLMTLKSKKPSPIFTVSDTNDIDLDLDDLDFGENPFVKSKFS